jgi:crotonobetainyl-CoA hydratase
VSGPAALVERRDHIMIITFNRPEAMNAVNADLALQVGTALEEADRKRDVRVVVITGAGERAFSAGADLKVVARHGTRALYPEGKAHWGFAGITHHPISKPIIAAVNGFALGGGTEIALACDLVVAAERARFGLPEVSRGMFAASGGVVRLGAHLPRKIAMHMILTGEPIDAATALQWGLINQVTPDGQALDAALALAEKICRNAPLAVQASKRIALGIIDGDIPAEQPGWELTNAELKAIMHSRDIEEGPRAFAEKRPPRWEAR